MIVTLHDVAMSRRTGARLRGGLRGSELLLALVVLLGACSESTSPPDLVGPTDVRPDEGARSNECGAADAYVARRSSGVTLMGVDGLTAEACGRSLPGPGAFVAVDATSVLRWRLSLVGAAGYMERELVLFVYRDGCAGECLIMEGPAQYSSVEVVFPAPGTYWVGVDAPVAEPTAYALRLEPVESHGVEP